MYSIFIVLAGEDKGHGNIERMPLPPTLLLPQSGERQPVVQEMDQISNIIGDPYTHPFYSLRNLRIRGESTNLKNSKK